MHGDDDDDVVVFFREMHSSLNYYVKGEEAMPLPCPKSYDHGGKAPSTHLKNVPGGEAATMPKLL